MQKGFPHTGAHSHEIHLPFIAPWVVGIWAHLDLGVVVLPPLGTCLGDPSGPEVGATQVVAQGQGPAP